jgi:hypothetical protein
VSPEKTLPVKTTPAATPSTLTEKTSANEIQTREHDPEMGPHSQRVSSRPQTLSTKLDALYASAEQMMMQGHPGRATQKLQDLVKRAPAHPLAAVAYVELAQLAYRRHDWGNALRHISAAKQHPSQRLGPSVELLRCRILQGSKASFGEIWTCFERLVTAKPGTVQEEAAYDALVGLAARAHLTCAEVSPLLLSIQRWPAERKWKEIKSTLQDKCDDASQ